MIYPPLKPWCPRQHPGSCGREPCDPGRGPTIWSRSLSPHSSLGSFCGLRGMDFLFRSQVMRATHRPLQQPGQGRQEAGRQPRGSMAGLGGAPARELRAGAACSSIEEIRAGTGQGASELHPLRPRHAPLWPPRSWTGQCWRRVLTQKIGIELAPLPLSPAGGGLHGSEAAREGRRLLTKL